MSIVRDFEPEQPERPQGTEQFIPRKSEGRSARAVARGSLACPSCDLPLVAGGPIPMTARVRCPFCRSIHNARAFVRLEMPDTTLNEVLVTARLSLR
jgi:hypothetical protein